MKTLLAILTLALVGCGTTYTDPVHRLTDGIAGKHRDGACGVYAVALARELRKQGVEAETVSYRWRSRERSGEHVIVIYQHNGKTWGVDNLSGPVRLKNSNRQAQVEEFVFLTSPPHQPRVEVTLL